MDDSNMLLGSSVQPAMIDLGNGQQIQLGTVVADAYERSGLTVPEWNDLPDQQRESLIESSVSRLQSEAQVEVQTPPAATDESAGADGSVTEDQPQSEGIVDRAVDFLETNVAEPVEEFVQQDIVDPVEHAATVLHTAVEDRLAAVEAALKSFVDVIDAHVQAATGDTLEARAEFVAGMHGFEHAVVRAAAALKALVFG